MSVSRTRRVSASHVVYYTLLTLAAVIVLLPFVWMISTSFDKFDSYGLPFPPRLLPQHPSLFNYQLATTNMPIFRYLLNTMIIVVLSVVLNVFTATLAGFCLSKGRFPGKGILFIFLMSNMMIPFEIKLMPIYNIIKGMGLTNNYLGVVLPGVMTNAMFIFFIKKFCDDLPSDIYEAGVVDGASKFRIYAQLFVPLMGPVIATLAVLDVVNVWNDLLWPMVVLSKDSMKTIQVGMVVFGTNSEMQTHAGIATAVSVMSILPLAVVFTFMQKYIVQSIAATGLKQ